MSTATEIDIDVLASMFEYTQWWVMQLGLITYNIVEKTFINFVWSRNVRLPDNLCRLKIEITFFKNINNFSVAMHEKKVSSYYLCTNFLRKDKDFF